MFNNKNLIRRFVSVLEIFGCEIPECFLNVQLRQYVRKLFFGATEADIFAVSFIGRKDGANIVLQNHIPEH